MALRFTSKLSKSFVRFNGAKAMSTSSVSPVQPLSVLTEDEEALRENVARFAKEKVTPLVMKMDEESKMDKSIIQGCFEQGYMGLEVPEKYGGAGLNFMSTVIAVEELAKVDPSVSVFVDVQNTLAILPFLNYGNEEIKAKYLPQLATEKVGCFCLSEPGAGSDAFALKTSATKDGNNYILNGTKCWITNSGEADIFVVLANVDFSKGYKGITAFAVEKGTPGLSLGKKENKLGIRASSTCEVILDNVKVPAENIVGELGKGYKIAIETLNEGRVGIGAQMIGCAEGALEYIMPYLHQRKQFGQPIADFQGMQFQYAELAMKVHAAKLMVYDAARLKDAGKPFVQEAAMAKTYAANVAGEVTARCVELLGGVGFTKEFAAEKFYRDCIIGKIYEGTTNMNLLTIAKCMQAKYK